MVIGPVDLSYSTGGVWALWAPKVGYLHGTLGLSRAEARIRLQDRVANGEACEGERVARLRVTLQVAPDGGVTGHLC